VPPFFPSKKNTIQTVNPMNHTDKPFKILFLCTGNSARSIMAEYLMPMVAPKSRFEAYSAGATPKGEVHPMSIRVLKEVHRIDAEDAHPKSWDIFKEDGTAFDFVITVCDNAKESCPVWPGQPIIAHWGSIDPAAVEGDEQQIFDAFKRVSIEIRRRLELFTSLPFEKLDKMRLQKMTDDIGKDKEATEV